MVKHSSVNKQRIIRTLLNNPTGNLTKYRVAKESECKFSTTHRILKELEDLGLIYRTHVVNYKALINEWVESQIKPRKIRYLIKDPIKLLKNSKLKYGLTTYVAENMVQRYLFPSVTEFYIDSSQIMEWRNLIVHQGGLIGKGNTAILEGDIHAFYKSFKKDNLTCVSIPQLILDLINEGGVCIEAANKLIEREEDALSEL